MKIIIKLTILIFLLTMINDIAFSKSVFDSHEYNDIIKNTSSGGGGGGLLGKKVKVILSVGELGQFTMGHTGTYSNLVYGFAVNPETRFEVNGHLGAGFALGAGGSLFFKKLHDSTSTNVSYRWSVGPSLYIFFAITPSQSKSTAKNATSIAP